MFLLHFVQTEKKDKKNDEWVKIANQLFIWLNVIYTEIIYFFCFPQKDDDDDDWLPLWKQKRLATTKKSRA